MVKRIVMDTIKISSDEVSLSRMRTSVLVYGTVCCALYIVFLLLMKMAGLMHVTELRMVNYVILCLVGFYQIRKMVKQSHSYVPFLGVFATVLFTGLWSFFLFSVFLYAYTRFDIALSELFVKSTHGYFPQMPSVIIFFEGTAASIIVGFINMQYFRRFEEGEEKA
jgi:hypothetical protein